MPRTSQSAHDPTKRGVPEADQRKAGRQGCLALFFVLAVGATAPILMLLGSLSPDAQPRSTAEDAAFAHVHDLEAASGADAGSVFAATHKGLFLIAPAGEVRQVGPGRQDLMSFEALDGQRFLASGHPAANAGGPNTLGLIESTDAGLSWRARSLAGEVDFHALESRGRTVWGLDAASGRLLVTSDARSWQPLSATAIADFSLSPRGQDAIVATTAQGLVLSDDGGATFRLLPGSPVAPLVDWAPDGSLVAVDSAGVIYGANGVSGSWTRQGTVEGTSQAIALSGEFLYLATDQAIWRSPDRGQTMERLTEW